MHDFYDWLGDLGIDSIDYDQLFIAFTHKSYKGMNNEDVQDNERFEFLGDAVLDLITAEDLFYDDKLTESEMTEIRKNYVSNDQLAVIFMHLEMEKFVRVAKKLKLTNRIKAGFVEAFFGVLYFEKGYDECHRVWQVTQERLSRIEEPEDTYYPKYESWYNHDEIYKLKNPKTTLQEFCQSLQFGMPDYQVIKRTGPDHAPNYTIKLIIKLTIKPGLNKIGFENVFEKSVLGETHVTTHGKGKNIKLAQKRAAEKMCDRIGLAYRSDTYD